MFNQNAAGQVFCQPRVLVVAHFASTAILMGSDDSMALKQKPRYPGLTLIYVFSRHEPQSVC